MTTTTSPSSPQDPWSAPAHGSTAAPDRAQDRARAFDQASWASPAQRRQELHRAQDDPHTGFEPVSADLARKVGRRPALTVAARALRAAGNLFRHDPSSERLIAAASGVQLPVITGRRLAVVSLRGGSGKTTVAALLARTFASIRPEPAVAVDLDPALGSLALRLSDSFTAHRAVPSVDHAVRALGQDRSAGQDQVAQVLDQAGSHLLVTGPRGTGLPLGEADLTTALSAFSRIVPVTVVDCPTGLEHPDTAQMLAQCHAAVFAVPSSAAGVDEAASFLRHWQQDPFLSSMPVAAVVTATDRSSVLDPLDQAAALSRLQVMSAALRYDRHLAGGVGIALPLLLPENRRAVAELAGGLLAAANAHRAPASGRQDQAERRSKADRP